MAIKEKDIKRLLSLSMLSCSDDELKRLKSDLESFENRFRSLDEVEVSACDNLPRAHESFTRADVVKDSCDREEILKSAANTEKGCFVVPRVVE